jgi:plastocyanin
MRLPLSASLTLCTGLFAGLVAAGPAAAAPATIDWREPVTANPTINAGEAVTWNVVEGGHNVDVFAGPETFKSTSGTDKTGTQFSHTFNTPGTYKFVCDYHSSMKGVITVVAAQPAPGASPSPSPGGAPAGQPSAPVPSGNSPQAVSGPAGPVSAGAAGAAGVDAAAPTLGNVAFRGGAVRMRLSEAAKLTVRYVRAGGKAHVVVTKTATGRAGQNTVAVARWMRPGRYRMSIVAVDAAGNASKAARLKLTVRR